MSELKATTAQEIVRNEKDCDYMDELFGGVKMPPTQVYLKAEADKVIAELKNKLQNVSELINETREWIVESQKLHKRCADNAVKVIADLQAQKAQAEDDCAYWKNLAQKRNLTQPHSSAKEK
jgi:tRNA U34 5-carboxymethylaminomethyl modifying GTPase MnmE/TrmE